MLLGKSTQDNTEVVLSSPALGVHIIGAKRMGKSTLFEHLIAEVLQSDQGLCLLDPHGDLVRTVVALIPENRLKDVIVFNPLDIAYPIGLNLYACKDPAHDTAVKSTITRIMHIF